MRFYLLLLCCLLLRTQQAAAFVIPLSSMASRTRASTTTRVSEATDNTSEPSAVPVNTNNNAAAVVEEEDDDPFANMDFEAGFRARLQKEGGLEGLKARAAEKKRDEVKQQIKGQLNQWQGDQAVLVVCALVLLVVGLALSAPEPFERGSNGEELLFGLRASDW